MSKVLAPHASHRKPQEGNPGDIFIRSENFNIPLMIDYHDGLISLRRIQMRRPLPTIVAKRKNLIGETFC